MSDGIVVAGDVGGGATLKVGMPRALVDVCSIVLVLSQTSPVAHGSSLPGMWHDWLLDLKQIINNPQMYVMISDQDEDLLSYMINLNINKQD